MFESSYAYLITLLVALVEVKYQGSNTDPFQQHATVMLLFLTSALTYVIAFIQLQMPTDNNRPSTILRVLSHVSGILANELLLFVLVNPFHCFIINVSSILLVLAHYYCYQLVSPLFSLRGIYLEWIDNLVGEVEEQSPNDDATDLEGANVETTTVESIDLEAANVETTTVESMDLEATNVEITTVESMDLEAAVTG